MTNNNKSRLLLYLWVFIIGIMVIPMLVSCGKSGVSAGSNSNARMQIVNLSPDIQPFNLYAFYIKQGTNAYSYPLASGYFLINAIDTPYQIRTAQTTNGVNPTNLLTLQGKIQPKVPYTWFVAGLRNDSSLTSILTVDTGSLPANGRGKIRFVNASPGTIGLDLTANASIAFKDVKYKQVTDYLELTAGSYNLNVAATNAPTTVLSGLPNFTVLDGKLYTMYFYGLASKTDTAAYGANIILNSLPPGTTY
ncbi:MAG: DUF4397 domain-containing protein [Mucilaginibacter sp.]|jgi:hypothetical protein|uniref:DUF4397 domain-containing protein n=1 Tax=Mucilaginibacter sp. TaxID=1882438 RepID=UPI0035634C53